MTALKCKRLPHITLPAVHTYTYLLVADIFTLPVKSAVFILTIYGKNVHFYYHAGRRLTVYPSENGPTR